MEFLTPNAVKSLAFAAVQGLSAAVLAGTLISCGRRLTAGDKAVMLWVSYSMIVHYTLESAFVYYSLTSTILESEGFMADVWKEYVKADYRWGVSDPTVVALEMLTVPLNGTLSLILLYAIVKDKPYRHFVQVVLNVCELYGGWMTFCPEWLTGSPNLQTSNWLYLWVYLVFFNGLWVVFPLLLLLQSWTAITTATKTKTH